MLYAHNIHICLFDSCSLTHVHYTITHNALLLIIWLKSASHSLLPSIMAFIFACMIAMHYLTIEKPASFVYIILFLNSRRGRVAFTAILSPRGRARISQHRDTRREIWRERELPTTNLLPLEAIPAFCCGQPENISFGQCHRCGHVPLFTRYRQLSIFISVCALSRYRRCM